MKSLLTRHDVSRLGTALAVLCLSLSAAAKGQDKKPAEVDVTGTWRTRVEIAGQAGEPTFTLTQNGDKITGRYIGSFGEQEVTGRVTGDKAEFNFDIDQGTVTYNRHV